MQLALENISKKVGAQTWLYDMDLALHSGAVTVLLGATQAGKTSLMRIMAGLDTPTAGRVLVDGADVTGMPVRERNVAMVYQQFINYPSMTVAANIASPLKLRGEKHIDARVRELAERLHIDMFLKRLPAELSGGQQQRVALARSMVMEPKVLLLDEPLSNLDARLRLEMRTELQRVQKETGVTMIFVTHDQIEALALADRIVVMKGGKIEQIGTPEDIYNAPVSSFVADFVGFENIFALEGGALKTANGTTPLTGPVPSASGLAWRPRMVTLGSGPFQGTVRGTSFAGNTREYLLDTPLGAIKAETDAALTVHTIGDTLAFDLPVEKAASLKVFG